MANVLITNRQQVPIDLNRIKQVTEQILNALGFSKSEISLLFTDDLEIAELNRTYRGVNSPTDVLAFPMGDNHSTPPDVPHLLGDVVISVPMAEGIAKEHGISLNSVIDVLLCHGVLHLIGYDHDNPEKAREMDLRTVELLEMLGYKDADINWYLTSKGYMEE